MLKRMRNALRDESGVAALETAIILIAFVVVAAVFAFTVLSAGTTTTERGKEAILSGLQEVSSSLELRGSVLAVGNTPGVAGTGQIGVIQFTVGNVAGGSAIDLTDTTVEGEGTGNNKIVIDYRDAENAVSGLAWKVEWPVRHDEDNLLEDGELARVLIDLPGQDTPIELGPDTAFAIEVKPPRGGVLLIQKTTPSYIDTVIDFN